MNSRTGPPPLTHHRRRTWRYLWHARCACGRPWPCPREGSHTPIPDGDTIPIPGHRRWSEMVIVKRPVAGVSPAVMPDHHPPSRFPSWLNRKICR